MKDVILHSDGTIVFYKKLWHDSEILLAKCFNFEINIESGEIKAFVLHTFKKAVYEFVRLSFKNFSESIEAENRRNSFYTRLDEMYETKDKLVDDIASLSLPYYDKLYAHQIDTIKLAYYNQYIFGALDMGLGKAQPLTAKVFTPSGYKIMGDIKIGDSVFGSDGNPCVVTGVYPQGKIPYFRVHFSDNTYTECCDDHLWICRPINLDKKWDWRVKPLKELRNDLIYKTKDRNLSKWAIPKTEPVNFNKSSDDLKPIHPYLLGVLLGDGCLINSISISTNDHDELIPIIKEMLPAEMVIKKQSENNYSWNVTHKVNKGNGSNPLINQIKTLGLFGLKSYEKFVPEQYLFTSIEERIDILSGLLDTDGHVSLKGSRLSMTTTSPMIKNAVIFLVQSLGGTATFGEDEREGFRVCYYVNINLPNNIIPFKLSRRIKRYRPKQRLLARKIISIEYMGNKECQCISVDSFNNSYLTDNFIVTHNTLISASLSRMLKVPRTVIVCPAAVKWNWYRDLTHWGFNELFFTILDSTKRRTVMALNERFLIINYDIVDKFEKHLSSGEIGHFIFDESHYLKNHASKRYKEVKKLVDKHPNAKVTFLSGTPVSNRVNDIFAYMKLIGHQLGDSYQTFLKEYTISTSSRGGSKVTGGRNLQDLNTKLSNFMIRKTKEECLDLPDKIFMSYRYEMDDYRAEYDAVIEELSKNKELSSLTGNLHSLNIITSKAKIKGIIEITENIIEQGRKVVVFGSYKEPLNQLEAYFKEKCVKIDGSVDSWMRDQHIQRFHNDPECDVFLGNMKAAGVGINLTNASDVLFINFPFTPAELYQAIDRCNRIGQKNTVNVHYTFCDDSIDEYIYDIIVDKEKDINALIDQGKEVLLRENTTEILMKKLLKRDDIIIDTPFVEVQGEKVKESGIADDLQPEVDRCANYELGNETVVLPEFQEESVMDRVRETEELANLKMEEAVERMNNNGTQFFSTTVIDKNESSLFELPNFD